MRSFLGGVPLDWLTYEELTRKLSVFVVSRKPHHITTVNPEFIVLSQTNPAFRDVLKKSDLSVVDGTGIVIAHTFLERSKSHMAVIRWLEYFWTGLSFLLSPQSFPHQRITGVALTEHLMRLSAKEGWKVFLLGGMPGVAKQAAEIWQSRYPELTIVGTSDTDPDNARTIPLIREAKPDVLVVAYGTPKQELFLGQNKDELKIPVMVGVGGTFDTLVGRRYNPPRFIKSLGLEWLMYLLRHPSRFKRIWRSTVGYSCLVVNSQTSKNLD